MHFQKYLSVTVSPGGSSDCDPSLWNFCSTHGMPCVWLARSFRYTLKYRETQVVSLQKWTVCFCLINSAVNKRPGRAPTGTLLWIAGRTLPHSSRCPQSQFLPVNWTSPQAWYLFCGGLSAGYKNYCIFANTQKLQPMAFTCYVLLKMENYVKAFWLQSNF